MSNTVASDECDEIGSVDDIETDYEDSDDLDAPVKQEHFDDANAVRYLRRCRHLLVLILVPGTCFHP